MDARFTAEQDEIRSALRELLRRRCGPAESRSAVDTPAGYDPELWKALAQQLGLPGLALPEEYGGVGCSVTELALACEEMGRVLAATPLLGTAVLVAPLVLALGTAAQRADLLPRIASGALTAALAVPPGTALALTGDNRGDWAGGGRAGGVQARPVPDTGRVSGAPGTAPTGRPSAGPTDQRTPPPLAGAAPGGAGADSAGRSTAARVGQGTPSPLTGAPPGGAGADSAGRSTAARVGQGTPSPLTGAAPGGAGADPAERATAARVGQGTPSPLAGAAPGGAGADPAERATAARAGQGAPAPGATPESAGAGRSTAPVAGQQGAAAGQRTPTPLTGTAPGTAQAGRPTAAAAGQPGAMAGQRKGAAPAERSGTAAESANGIGQPTAAPAPRGTGWRLYGQVDQVLGGHSAGLLLVAAHVGGFARSRTLLFLVRGDAPGLVRTRQTALDATRPQARVQLRDVEAEPLGDEDGSDVLGALARTGDTAAAVLACEAVGAAERVLEMTVDHVRQREQFGRVIGSFQAVKHRLADVYVQLQAARSAAYFAAWAAAGDGQRVGGLALAQALEALRTAAAEAIQLHGGMGFTWEHQAQLYFKRATGDDLLFGPAHRLRAHAADTARLFERAEVTV